MTHAATTPAKFSPVFVKAAVTGLAVAATMTGLALLSRGPDFDATFAPLLAEHAVILPDGSAIHVQKYEVTVAEWNACHTAGACTQDLRVTGNRSAEQMPATGLSYVDAGEYLTWINAVTGHEYRLPSLMEWEYMAAEVLPEAPDPIFTDPELTWASAYLMEPQTKRTLRAQGTFETTSAGIVDLNGSVWEWTSDCYAGVSEGIMSRDRCPAFFVGGEHIAAMSFLERDPARGGCAVGVPPAHLGMRLVTDARP